MSPIVSNLIEKLPKGLVIFLSKKIVKRYVDKYANIKISGIDNLNNIKQPTIFICNHLSNSDGLVMDRILKKFDPTFVAGIKLSKNAFTNMGIYTVKTTPLKPNTADKEGISKIVSILKNGENIVIFPEGTRSRSGKMIEAKKGLLLISKLSKAPIVPLGVYGTENLLPINNSEMMEKEKFQHADVYVNIGAQFEIPGRNEGEDRKEYEERASRYAMLQIAELIPEEYRGFYNN